MSEVSVPECGELTDKTALLLSSVGTRDVEARGHQFSGDFSARLETASHSSRRNIKIVYFVKQIFSLFSGTSWDFFPDVSEFLKIW